MQYSFQGPRWFHSTQSGVLNSATSQARHCALRPTCRAPALPRRVDLARPEKRRQGYSCSGHSLHCNASEATAETQLPAELEKIVTTFSMVPDPKLKYQQLLYLAKKLQPMPAAEHTEENKVRGCVSQVWVVPDIKGGKVFWRADSDSMLTKGLAALLCQGLSDCTPEQIVRIQPEFLEKLGLGQALTPSRNNGFLNMFKLMQAKALQLLT